MHGSKQPDFITVAILSTLSVVASIVITSSLHGLILQWLLLGLICGFAVITLDRQRRLIRAINDQQQLENTNTELVLAKQAAEQSNSNKSDFLARISHEIRTPLNAILGFSELLLNNTCSSDRHHQIILVRQSARHLLQLIDDLLDLARLEAGHVQLQEEPFNLRTMLDETIACLSPLFSNHPVVPVPIIDVSCNIEIEADARALRQIVVNLLSNAIKYTPAGQIVLRVAVSQEHLTIMLTDTGMGMTKQQLSQLFQPFVRHHETESSEQGTGLGMAITLQLLHLMAAHITINSEPDQGTAIELSIPIRITKSGHLQRHIFGRVTVIHSKPLVMEALQQMALTVSDNSQCYNYMPDINSINEADLILIAAEFWLELSNIEQTQLTKSTVRLIQKPGECDLEMRNNVRCLTFPFGLDKLVISSDYVNHQEPALTLIKEPQCFTYPILIVDDNPVNLEFMQRLLAEMNIESVAVLSGLDALKQLEKQEFSLVFLDIRMPVMDGMKTYRAIKALGLNVTPPIIAVTANAMFGQAQHYRQNGFDDYLSKPVTLGDIQKLLGKHKQPKLLGGLNWSKSLVIAGNDQQLARDMLTKLLDVLPELNKTLERYQNKASLDSDYIHKVLGLVSYTGAEFLKEQLSTLEKCLRSHPQQHHKELVANILLETNRILAQGLNIINPSIEKSQKLA